MQLQTASGFGSILSKKPLQPSEIYPGKMVTPVRFRLPFHTDRETPQVARCDDPKKCSSRQLPAFGQSPVKSPASLRRCTPEKCLRPSASGCFFTPTARPLKRPVAMTRKSTAQDGLRLLVNSLPKVPPAPGNITQPFVSGYRL